MPHIDVVPPFIYVKKHIYPHFTLAQNGEKAKAFPQRNAFSGYRKVDTLSSKAHFIQAFDE